MSAIPESCPSGTEMAGKASACAGCPSQKLCASGQTGPDPDVAKIASCLKTVQKKILVLSGKGGVQGFESKAFRIAAAQQNFVYWDVRL